MSDEQKQKYIDALSAERERLVRQIEQKGKPADFGDDVDDVDSIEAEEAEELSNQLAVAQALRERVSEIDRVLNDLASGKEISETELAKLAGLPPH